jgi:DNA-binding transcriptional LysR family regulator
MELRQLITFRTVAQTLSFSRTAANLNYAQSTVSTQIQALEEELGVTLFDRLGKRVVLTDAGQRLLNYAEKMLTLEDEARAVVSNANTLSGSLVISSPETLCAYRLPPILRRFRDRFPQVQLSFCPEYDTTLFEAIRDGVMDVAIVMAETVPSSQLVIEPLITEPMLIMAYPEHPLVQSSHVTFADLQDEPFILTEATCNYRRLFEDSFRVAGVPLAPPMEFHSVEAIKQCVMARIGLSFLPLVAVEKEIEQGRMVPLRWAGRDFRIVTQMVWHKDKWLSPALKAFLNIARDMLQADEHIHV